MPFYELTLITRSLSKADLVKALVRAGNTLLNQGAVIEKVESLGHRDLAYRRIAKQTNEKVYTSNMFLFWTHMSREMRESVDSILRQDLDTVHVGIVTNEEKEPIECNLEELLKPPAERQAVKELREKQKMGHFTRQIVFKRTEKEWRSIPKSYPIAPPRY
ncbi:unnamed protein product, partial [Mesorhabditis belari]|uniref:Small ribosomal subunit protein bS6m n=1 Tax=Mesorhabditis belari TaxID=2138241 RepID=A0AAF3F4I2_9BILA